MIVFPDFLLRAVFYGGFLKEGLNGSLSRGGLSLCQVHWISYLSIDLYLYGDALD